MIAETEFETAATKTGLRLERDKALAPLTQWRIGGPARWYLFADTFESARQAIILAEKYQVPTYILGGGTNVLVSDSGFPGLVIKLSAAKLEKQGEVVWADAGASMGALAVFCMQNRLSGMEWAVGIPGTVGGAVVGNSNCFGGSTSSNFLRAEVLGKNGRIISCEKEYFNFRYDYSSLQGSGEILLRAAFRLETASDDVIRTKQREILEVAKQRATQQPLGAKSAGSTFKAILPTPENVEKIAKLTPEWRQGLRDGLISAGFIIDKCLGLKGYETLGMKISEIHANFFINTGQATAKDAKWLIDYVKKMCKNKLRIELEEEIKYIGDFSK